MIFWHIWLWTLDHPIAGGWVLAGYFALKGIARIFYNEDD